MPCTQSHADIITYRFGKDLVYVSVAHTYKAAIQQAQEVYPKLRELDTLQICLMLTVTVRGESLSVRIGPKAWESLRNRISQYEILDIHVSEKPCYLDIEIEEQQKASTIANGAIATEDTPPVYEPNVRNETSSFWNRMVKLMRIDWTR